MLQTLLRVMSRLKDGVQLVADFIVDKLRNELEEQGHNDTGALIRSINGVVRQSGNSYTIEISAVGYAKYLETGIAAGNWVNVYALAEWVERKGIATGEKEIKSAAFAIRRKIYNEGSPTRGSYKFSGNGRRKEFITVVMDENAIAIFDMLVDVFSEAADIEITNAISKNKKTFETA